jgi:hypothetical protein
VPELRACPSAVRAQVLDAHNEVDVIKQVYMGIMPDFDQSTFFKSKGWSQ